MAAPGRLLSLPAELLQLVLGSLEYPILCLLRRVSRFFKNLIDNSVALQYNVLLRYSGMEDCPHSGMGISERLRRLEEHTAAWKTMTFDTSGTSHRLKAPADDAWQLSGGMLARSDGSRGIIFNQLPGRARGIPARRWHIRDVGFIIKYLTMVPSQDLLLLVEDPENLTTPCTVHVRSLSTGSPHPEAVSPEIRLPHPHSHTPECCYNHLVACGDHIGFALDYLSWLEDTHLDFEIFIYNWKTGELLLNIRSPEGNAIDAFTFLSEQYILLGISKGHSMRLEVYNIFNVIGVSRPNMLWTGNNYICAFAFTPAEGPGAGPAQLHFLHDPFSASSQARSPAPPFVSSERSRVLAVSRRPLDLGRADSTHCDIMLHFIPMDVLLSGLSQALEGKGKLFSWEHWGHQTAAQALATEDSPFVPCDVHGSKYARLWTERLNDFPDISRIAEVRDFAHLQGSSTVRRPVDDRYRMYRSDVLAIEGMEDVFVQARAISVMVSEDNLIVVDQRDLVLSFTVLSL
ncbi:hypothetical protein OE88DRAFT_859210 [Heliocybe sulcata]|uniref:F-box domain-containing protein n=1 Tax=Heliocybe sulcata TaxID=5364 RepID=A0A5C3MPH2_9AGAM|nr:hypothetical protein OE88DRAFT_859210 [Heliocybe sulcata]